MSDYARKTLAAAIVLVLSASALIIAVSPAAAAAPSFEWTRQTPPEFEYAIKDVSAVDATHAWAVGYSGSIWRYDGASWQAGAYFFNTLTGVHALDAGHVWAVGVAGQNHFFDGTGWAYRQEPTNATFYDVRFHDALHGWAVGLDGALYYSDDGGATWTDYSTPTDTTDYYCVDVDSADPSAYVVWVGGAGGMVTYQTFDPSTGPAAAWSTPAPGVITGGVNDIDMTDASNGWAVDSDGKAYATSNGGAAWIERGLDAPNGLNAIEQIAAGNVLAVGYAGGVWRFNGSLWQQESSGTTEALYGLDCVDASHAWAVGGAVAAGGLSEIRFFDGSTWGHQFCPAGYNLSGLSALDASHLFACADNWGKVLSGDGATMSFMDTSTLNGNLRDIEALSSGYVWSVGDIMGPDPMLWLYSCDPPSWDNMSGAGYGSPPVQNYEAIDAINTNYAWAVGLSDACVLWNGSTWATYDPEGAGNLWGVHARSLNDVWAVGDAGRVIRFQGSVWQQVPTGVGDTLYGVCALSTTSVWVAGANGKVLEYDGSSWHDRSPAGFDGEIYSLSGINRNNLWICGQDGLWFFDGSGWTQQDLDTDEVLHEVVAVSAADVFVVGNLCTAFRGKATPTVSSVTPATGENTGQVNISNLAGTCFAPGAAVSLRKAGLADIAASNVNVLSDTKITCDLDLTWKAAGAWDVVVTNVNGKSATKPGAFAVTAPTVPAPTVTGVSPSSGPPGIPVTVTGSDFGATRGPGCVTFGGVQAGEYASWSDSSVVAVVPAGAKSGAVRLFTDAGGSNDDRSFTIEYPAWYLAEGTTAWGFDTYVSVENPRDHALTAKVTYMKTGSGNTEQVVTLPAKSQTTIFPRDLIGDYDFSTKVECLEGETIAVDRTMMWTGEGAAAPEAHSSVGVNSPATTWYLPEGSTDWGFECWLLIQNPGATEAVCELTYMLSTGAPVVREKRVPAASRATFNVADDIGRADASIMVRSDVPVIPERAMYRNGRREGHDSIGTTAASTDYFLAEGTSAWGFTTFILIQNPNPTPADVTVTYMTASGPAPQAPFEMPANSRKTIRVNDVLPDADFSTRVSGSLPVIAERAMYWDAGAGEACHDSIGLTSAHSAFYLPDGENGGAAGAETFTLVQNPEVVPVDIRVTYLKAGGGEPDEITRTMAPGSRETFNMSTMGDGRAAVMVECLTPARNVMVERAMYFSGRAGGTDTIGGYSD